MLQINAIRESEEKVLAGLKKRNFKDAEQLVAEVLHHDRERRKKQVARDEVSADVNAMSSQIGGLMKEGKKEEAEKIRALVAGKKETIKTLEGEVNAEEMILQELLY